MEALKKEVKAAKEEMLKKVGQALVEFEAALSKAAGEKVDLHDISVYSTSGPGNFAIGTVSLDGEDEDTLADIEEIMKS